MATLDDPDLAKALRGLGYSNADILMMKDLARHAATNALKAAMDVVHLAPENLQPPLALITLTEITSRASGHVAALGEKLKVSLGGF